MPPTPTLERLRQQGVADTLGPLALAVPVILCRLVEREGRRRRARSRPEAALRSKPSSIRRLSSPRVGEIGVVARLRVHSEETLHEDSIALENLP